MATSTNAGVALGAAGAGVISDRVNPDAALLAGAAALGLTALLVLAGRTRLDPAAAPPLPGSRTGPGDR